MLAILSGLVGLAITAALSGNQIIRFWTALFALGLGWNLAFIGRLLC